MQNHATAPIQCKFYMYYQQLFSCLFITHHCYLKKSQEIPELVLCESTIAEHRILYKHPLEQKSALTPRFCT